MRHAQVEPAFRQRLIRILPRAACLVLLGCLATVAHAAGTYRCVDSRGHVAFQDAPCTASSRQSEIALQPQPLIGAPGEAATLRANTAQRDPASRPARRHASRPARTKPVMSWECRAADGEVFYRHTRCPASVPGDGVVRGDGMLASRSRSRRGNAWGRIPVHGTKITRSEACQRIHAIAADARDGRQHDESVSVYDHLMGRDPCGAP